MTRSGTAFNGDDIRGEPVSVELAEPVPEPLGSAWQFQRLGARGWIEFPTDPAETPVRRRGLVAWFEARSALTAAITALLVAVIAGFVLWGVPRASRYVAFRVPSSLEIAAGRAGLGIFRGVRASDLSWADEERVRMQLSRLTRTRRTHVPISLLFLPLDQANAFALPGGTIVVTDPLLALGLTDDQIAAVLAHELGHIEMRHGLRTILSGSGSLLVVTLITGDLSTLTTFSATLPSVLLTNGYSRAFELEADEHAVRLLQQAGIDPMNLAGALRVLEKSRSGQSARQRFSYLGTHPSNAQRIERIRLLTSQARTPKRTP